MRFSLLFVLGFPLISTLWAMTIEETPISKKAALIAAEGRKASLADVNPANRPEVVAILRQVADGTVSNIGAIAPSRLGAEIALLTLGDRQTIQRLMQEYRSENSPRTLGDLPRSFERSRQPLLIPPLAEDLFLEDEYKPLILRYGRDGVEGLPLPFRSGTVLLRIMRESDAFNSPLKQWTLEMERLSIYEPDKFRTHLRKWWELNREAFDQQRYQSVQPLASTEEETVAAQNKPGPTPQERPTVSAGPTSEKNISLAEEPASESSGGDWILIGGAIAALVAAAAVWKFFH